jgi:hypothetical protein
VIVLEVELKSGFITIRYDPPETLKPHKSRIAYYQDYVTKASKLLGTPLEQFPLRDVLLALEESPLVRLPSGRVRTADGQVDLKSRQPDPDYRSMALYEDVQEEMTVKDSGRYIWLSDPAAKKLRGRRKQISSVEELMRDVPTHIDARTSMVRYTTDVVPPEVAYVLGQIRTNA